MTFTAEQIKLIEEIVDARLSVFSQSRLIASEQKPWHTIPEIRAIIIRELPFLVEWFGDDEFDIAVFRHVLMRKTVMKPRDLEIPNPDHQDLTRWEAQVLNAINTSTWPECPVVSTGKRRRYRIYQPKSLEQC